MRNAVIAGIVSAAVVVVGGVLLWAGRVEGTVPVTPYEADVNKNGAVNAQDLGQVASKFGQPVPTATATAAPATIVGDRAFVYRDGVSPSHPPLDLIDTTNNAVVRSFEDAEIFLGAASCNGVYAVLSLTTPGSSYSYRDTVIVIDTRTGATVAAPETPGGEQPGILLTHVKFPCALRLGGATVSGGAPATNRVAISWTDVYPPVACPIAPCAPVLNHVVAMDLISGALVFSDSQVDDVNPRLNCASDTLYYRNTPDLKSVRLSDGAATTLPNTQLAPTQPC